MRFLHGTLGATLFALALAACGDDQATTAPTSSTSTGTGGSGGANGSGGAGGAGGGGGSSLPPPICHSGTRWTKGTQAFQEATAQWGLETLKVEGVRLSAVDFDGDGWPDLLVRRGGNGADDFAPGGVRQTWLLRNTGHGTFEDVTESSGIRQNRTVTDATKGRPGEVVAFADVDNDGDLDLYTGVTNDPKDKLSETSELLLNNGDGTFSLGPADSAARRKPPARDVPAGASFIDFNRDGFVDLWVTQGASGSAGQQDRLYQGDGAGSFVDVTVNVGLKTASGTKIADLNAAKTHSVAWSAAACDLNNDGNAELLVASYGRAPNQLWQSTGPAGAFQFTNQSVASGYAFDERQDWRDNESARCWCKLHPTDADCDGVPAPKYIPCKEDADAFRWNHATDRELFRLGGNSAATLCADIDNDGHLDLVTGEIVHWDVGSSSDPAELLINSGGADVHFTRPGNEATGLTRDHISGYNEGIMTGSVLDFDNDGWADLYWGNSDYPGNYGLLYHQDSPGHFEQVPIANGIDHHRSHGSAVADFDRDGDLDLVVGHSLARCDAECYPTAQIRLFENVIGQSGNYVELTLAGGAGSNRAAIGARVTVEAGGVTQTKEVGGGHGHYGAQDDLTLHFGLGEACEAKVTVRWPDAALSTQSFELPAGYRFTLEQGGQPSAVTVNSEGCGAPLRIGRLFGLTPEAAALVRARQPTQEPNT